MLLSMDLEIVEKELWIKLWPSNFQNGIFEKITMTLVEVALIQASFLNVGSKQKNKNEHTVYHDIFIQKPGLLKTWKYRFSLVWVMEFSIISPSFNKSKTFSDNSNLQA